MREAGSLCARLALASLVACGAPKEAVDTVCSAMLPLDFVGMQFTYEGAASLQLVTPAMVVLTGATTHEGEPAWGVRQTVQRIFEGDEVQLVHESAYSCDSDGVWLLGGAVTTSLDAPGDLGTETYRFSEPVLVLPPDPQSGDVWSSDYASSGVVPGGPEDGPAVGTRQGVVVAAGTRTIDGESRKTITVELEDSTLDVSTYQTYARGIGLVEDDDYTLLGVAR